MGGAEESHAPVGRAPCVGHVGPSVVGPRSYRTWQEISANGSALAQPTTEDQKVVAGNGAANDGFGYRVAIDVDRALIGAYVDDAGGNDSGAAYVFEYDGASWQQTSKLVSSDLAAAGDRFGAIRVHCG